MPWTVELERLQSFVWCPRPWVGNLRPAKQNHPARSPYTNCSHCMARLVVLYFMSLRSLQILVLYTY